MEGAEQIHTVLQGQLAEVATGEAGKTAGGNTERKATG